MAVQLCPDPKISLGSNGSSCSGLKNQRCQRDTDPRHRRIIMKKSDLQEGERKVIQAIDWAEVKEYIKNTPQTSTVYIGIDSQNHKDHTAFGLAIVVHIESSKGGHMFVEVSKTKKIKSIRERLMKEVELVVTASLELLDIVGKRGFQVHLDINPDPKHKSNEICKEAIGYVTGQGFECVIKPDSFAATHVADSLIQ